MKVVRRHSKDKKIKRSLAQLSEWLDIVTRFYSTASVQLKQQYVNVGSLSLEPYQSSKALSAIDQVIRGIEECPLYSTQEMESKIYNLIDLCRPLATQNQRAKLESLRNIAFSNLYLAIQTNNLGQLLESNFFLWTPTMVDRLTLPLEDLETLAIVWAKEQTFDTCLREEDPLVWLIKKLIPQLPPIPPDSKLRASLLCKMCWNAWRNIPEEKFSIVTAIQANLPCQSINQIPIIFYTLVFRHWCAPFPHLVRRVLDKFQRNTDILNELTRHLTV